MMIERIQGTDPIAAAQVLYREGRFEEAAAALERAIATAPQAFEPRAMLGEVLLKLERPRRAMASFEEAVNRDPHLAAVCRPIDPAATEEARSNTVLENCRHILARYPAYAQAHYARATALLHLGRETEARQASEQALVRNPTVPAFYHVLIHTGDPRHNASAVASLEQLATVADELPIEERAQLHFLLAKAYEDQGRTADAFDQLQNGNTIKRGTIHYDEARELGRIAAIAAAFTPERIETLRGSGAPSDVPVFVVGMPRSGTTLVEQILASHPDVFGAGELTIMPDLIADGRAGANFPDGIADLPPDALARLGREYAIRIAALAPAAKRIVDKLPSNYLYTGLIHLALPHARIVHVKRDPLDTCFSCFGLSFAGEVGYAYDLGELGRYYRAYEALMARWRAVLPPDAMLDVQYEDLVADLPGQAQRMIAYCGLEWDARCLDFHKSRRTVVTASVHQVRQPLYNSSVGRARAYADQLGPLRAALGLP